MGFLLAWRLSELSKHRELAAEHGYVEAMLSLGEDRLAKCGNDYSYFHSGVLWLQDCSDKGSLNATLILAETFDGCGDYRIPDEWNLHFHESDRLKSALSYFERAYELGFESALLDIKRIERQLEAL